MNDTFTCGYRKVLGRATASSVFKHEGPNLDMWRVDRSCSYCGSMHPDDFMRYCEEGKRLGSTDKNYKVYVDDDKRIKFYFYHLDETQMQRFIELHNAKKLNFGDYPLYVMPFFMRAVVS